jgi:PPK2 family polyphosphate:nucleotide phosphotransferase
MKWQNEYRVKPGSKVRLDKIASNSHDGIRDKDAAQMLVAEHRDKLSDLQEIFYASQQRALLIVLQGMDTAGKDGTIRHIFSGINPQGCDVAAFKVPTELERRHHFLWRCQLQVPPRGMIGIFNRSHYEDVLSPRVHGAIDHKTVKQRLHEINNWEQSLADEGVAILKFYLHISHEEQTERLQARIDVPDKQWKLSAADFAERVYWPKYIEAYEELLSKTSHKHAPWFVIPSDHKWFRNAAISAILLEAMQGMKLAYPKPSFDPAGIDLHKESPKAAAKQALTRAGK